jgi:hypothetical protein
MVSAALGVSIVDTEFTSGEGYSSGDLAANADWTSMVGPNAFNVDATAGLAETYSVSNSFVRSNGNHVVYNTPLTSNASDDEWYGVVDFKVSNSAFPGLIATNVIGTVTNIGPVAQMSNVEYYDIGLTSDKTKRLHADNVEDALIVFRSTSGANLEFTFSAGGGNTRRLAVLTAEEAGWDPKFMSTNGAPTEADFETDDLRIAWTLRKTRTDQRYYADAVVSNITKGTSFEFDGDVQYLNRSNLYHSAASSVYVAMGHDGEAEGPANLSSTNSLINISLDSVSVDQASGVAPILVAPVVLTDGENGKVDVVWGAGEEIEEYDVLKSLNPSNSFSVVGTVNATNALRYTETGLSNGTAYYYIVRAKATGAVAADSEVVVAVPQVEQDGVILDTSFSSSEVPAYENGDILGQNSWRQGSVNSDIYDIVLAETNGYAETDGTPPNGSVYWNVATSNNVGDEWHGSMTFKLSTTGNDATKIKDVTVVDGGVTNLVSTTNGVSEMANQAIGTFGITSDKFERLYSAGSKTNACTIDLRGRNNSWLDINLLASGASRTMLSLSRQQLGWDPEWQNDTQEPDFETDEVQLDWTIRKSTQGNFYSTYVTATVSGTNVHDSGVWQTFDRPTGLYPSNTVHFGMGNYNGHDVKLSIDSISVEKLNAQPTPLLPPQNVGATEVSDGLVSLAWQATEGLEELSYNVLRSTAPSTNYTTLTNLSNSTFAFSDDTPTNEVSYFYIVEAVYPTGTGPADKLVVRPLPSTTVIAWNPTPNYVTANKAFQENEIPAGGVLNHVGNLAGGALILNNASGGTQSYTGPNLYGVSQTPTNENFSGNNGIRRGYPNFIKKAMANTPVEPLQSALIYMKDFTPFNVNDGKTYVFELEPEAALDQSGMVDRIGEALHMAIQQNGGAWYISKTTYNRDDGVQTIESLAAEEWTPLTEATSASTTMMTVTNGSYTVGSALTLDNITGVGFFYDHGRVLSVKTMRLYYGQQLTPYQEWSDEQKLYNSDATEDYDGDGLTNVEEWGLGGDPKSAENKGIEERYHSLDGTNFVYIYPKRVVGDAPSYHLEESSSLVHTNWSNEEVNKNYDIYVGEAGSWTTNGRPNFAAVTNMIPTDLDAKFIQLIIEE